jgi:hypothetical protein
MQRKTAGKPPWCPFCGQNVEPPADNPERKLTEFPSGSCECGAVYSCDATGHNVGAALVETLLRACNDNAELAWELLPEDDYLTGRLEKYDEQTHQVIETGNINGRAVRGVLYFVRLHTEMSELVARLANNEQPKRLSSATDIYRKRSSPVPPPEPGTPRRRADKKVVKNLMADSDVDSLAALCLDDRKTLRLAQRLLYDPDESSRWRVSWLLGQVCARVAERDPGQVSELLHRLFEASHDSAATPWGMVETIGAVIAARPDIFGAFAQHLVGFMGAESTRIQTIWALAEIAGVRPELVRSLPFYATFAFLGDPDPQVRGHTARLLGRLTAREASMQLMGLHNDDAPFTLYVEGAPTPTSVSEQARMAMQSLTT